MGKVKQVKTPSKFLSLEFLKNLQQNYYVTDTGEEYHADDVDELIYMKMNRTIDAKIEAQRKDYNKRQRENDF